MTSVCEATHSLRDTLASVTQADDEVGRVDVAHRDEQVVAVLPGLVDRDDVRVVDRGEPLGLVHEPPTERIVRREFRREDLERAFRLRRPSSAR